MTVAQALAPMPLRLAGTKEYVQQHLILRSGAAYAADNSPSARLKRTVLRCILLSALKQRADGGFELHPVLAAQLGVAVAAAVAADVQQQALYRTEGHSLRELQESLRAAGLILTVSVATTKYAAVRPEWIVRSWQEVLTGQAAPAAGPAARVLIVRKVRPAAQGTAQATSAAAPAGAPERAAQAAQGRNAGQRAQHADQGREAAEQRAQQAEQSRKAAEQRAQRAEREIGDLESRLRLAEQGRTEALDQAQLGRIIAQQQQREAGLARYAALERARVLQADRDSAERRADAAEAAQHAAEERAQQAGRELYMAQEQAAAAKKQATVAKQQAAAAELRASACPAVDDATWLSCIKRRRQLEMMLSIASTEGEFSQVGQAPAGGRRQALADAKQVLASALRVADYGNTAPPSNRKEVQLARRAVHPDKFVTAPGLVQAAVGLASRVVGSAADFLEERLM